MTEDQAGGTAQRSRGKGYPTLPLGEAHAYIAEAAKYGMTHHLNAFAQYLGHSKPSGGAFNHKIAAIRDWGLITRSGSSVTLTPLAERLALPVDPGQEAADLRTAFNACEIFREAYERNAKGQPLTGEAFGNAAVLNLGIAATARDRFVRSFVKSAVVAGLADEQANGTFMLRPLSDEPTTTGVPDSQDGLNDPADPDVKTDTPVGADPRLRSGASDGLRPAFQQNWQFQGGQLDISLTLTGPLPREAYAHIGTAMAELISLLESSTNEKAV